MRKKAFTLIELLVVVAIIAVLAAMILPALNQAKQKARAVQCLMNLRNINQAWLMYAHDWEDTIMPNWTGQRWNPRWGDVTPHPGDITWIWGYMGYGLTNHFDNIYRPFLQHSLLGPYLSGDTKVYLCPSDHTTVFFTDSGDNVRRLRWIRSIALNKWMSGVNQIRVNGTGETLRYGSNYKVYHRIAEIDNPAERYTFLDSRRDTIDNGFFENGKDTDNILEPGNLKWYEMPARYHAGQSSIMFSDGHAENHKWLTEWHKIGARYELVQQINGIRTHVNDEDILWLNRRSTRRK